MTYPRPPTNYELVLKWHHDFGVAIGKVPHMLTGDLAKLRIKLIEEEFKEYKDAIEAGDIIAAADALGDLLFAIYGTCVTHGFNADVVMAEITRSNNTKMSVDGNPTNHKGGKILKGPNFQPPRLAMVLGIQDEA